MVNKEVRDSDPPSAPSRTATASTQSARDLEGHDFQNQEAPRVRFSTELDRATASATAAERPAAPSLSIDTSSRPKVSSEAPLPAVGILSRKTSNALSPTSPRTRDRGYSLRRTLFARGINNGPENSPIELVEAGSSRDFEGGARRLEEGQGKTKQSPASITISPVVEGFGTSTIGGDEATPDPKPANGKDKKSFGTLSLPNYDDWVSKRKKSSRFGKVVTAWAQVSDRLFGQQEIPPSRDGRHIELDASRKVALIDERRGNAYMGNTIRSSRYTLWNFLPRQLFFQFSKLANFYFLLISILQMIPGLSTTGNYTTIIPLLVFVCISMAKEGYDDLRRYKLDQVENNRETKVLHAYHPVDGCASGAAPSRLRRRSEDENISLPMEGLKHWESVKWRDIHVGDIIKLKRDENVPADMVLLHSDGPNGIAYIETMALDGETNLKSKQAPTSLAKLCTSEDAIATCRALVVVEDPNIDLYNFEGRVTIEGETLPLTTNEIILRGSTLRNTSTAIGMVINTGEECKIRMNANKSPRIKSPAMQVISNKIVVLLVVFVILLALFCTIAYQIWAENVEERSWYLANAHVPFDQIIIGFIILYNTLIPLSLYVSLEIIKVGQLILMSDVEMYDPVSNTPLVCNTTTILENLGQVNYIFSDKTGTLTDNIMKFRKLSVAGYAWLHDFDLHEHATLPEHNREATEKGNSKAKAKGKGIANFLSNKKATRPALAARMESDTSSIIPRSDSVRRSGSISLWKSSARPAKAQPEMRTEDLLQFLKYKPHSIFTKKAKFFLLALALCHTCLPELQENGDIEFQAASPDELALVKAAQELGFMVIDRPARSITLMYPGGPDSSEQITETYDILDVIEFSSKRKRMSIIVRFPNGKICIFCKGADSALMPRLKLAPLAMEKKSEVTRRSSKRKSMEADQALRRLSETSPRNSFSRPSMALSRRSRKSIGNGRPSMASTRLQPIRDELDSWLKQRESDVDVEAGPEDMSAYQSPRISMNRQSFASDNRRFSSYDDDEFDDLIDEAIVLDDPSVFERCFQHIDDFASEGLRTLLFGYRFLDEQEYVGWKKIYVDATTSLVDRQRLIENAGEMIEQNFDLAGATAIEDKLQKGVPETVDKLRRANIKIWMLTGDKRETAINIAHSARIAKNYSEVVILDHTTGEVEQRMATTLLDISKGSIAHSVIVIDGQTLSEIDANDTLALLFFDLVVLADSVICCRASPSQKASLVRTIRTKVNKSITLAIGDGANDIAMIQEAHVGIGVSGKEGLQAARISDYSIAQFRFLQRLLLVHGRWNYIRTGKYILSTFWKELMFYLTQAIYQKWTGYTGTSLFESTSLTVFNTLFTSLPVIFLGIFEQDLNASTLLAVPELYTQGQRNEGFNIRKYLGWMFMASSESMIIYFTMYGLFGNASWTSQNDVNLLSMGTLCFTAAVVFINTKMLILEMHNKTIISGIGWILSIGGWSFWTIALSGLYKPTKAYPLYPIYRNFILHFGRDILWWMTLFITLTALILLEIGVSSVRKSYWPTDTDVFQELQKDAFIRRRFEETIRAEQEGGVGELDMGKEKTSMEARREGEIQELLDRPRLIADARRDAEVVRSPVELDQRDISRSASGRTLTRRKFSTDGHGGREGVEEFEMASRGSVPPRMRHSVDIGEVLGGR